MKKNHFNVALMIAVALMYAFINYATEKCPTMACAIIFFLNIFAVMHFERFSKLRQEIRIKVDVDKKVFN